MNTKRRRLSSQRHYDRIRLVRSRSDSMRKQRESLCRATSHAKVRYATLAAAGRVLDYQEWRAWTRGRVIGLSVYRCPACGSYHLSSHGGDAELMGRWTADRRHRSPEEYRVGRDAPQGVSKPLEEVEDVPVDEEGAAYLADPSEAGRERVPLAQVLDPTLAEALEEVARSCS